jgi:hypothetical protein
VTSILGGWALKECRWGKTLRCGGATSGIFAREAGAGVGRGGCIGAGDLELGHDMGGHDDGGGGAGLTPG